MDVKGLKIEKIAGEDDDLLKITRSDGVSIQLDVMAVQELLDELDESSKDVVTVFMVDQPDVLEFLERLNIVKRDSRGRSYQGRKYPAFKRLVEKKL